MMSDQRNATDVQMAVKFLSCKNKVPASSSHRLFLPGFRPTLLKNWTFLPVNSCKALWQANNPKINLPVYLKKKKKIIILFSIRLFQLAKMFPKSNEAVTLKK